MKTETVKAKLLEEGDRVYLAGEIFTVDRKMPDKLILVDGQGIGIAVRWDALKPVARVVK